MLRKRGLTTLVMMVVATMGLQGVSGAHPASGAANGKTDWSEVQALRSGSKVVVTVKGSAPQRCLFLGADDGHIRVTPSDGPTSPETIDRDDVAQIDVEESAWKKGALIGLAVGAAYLPVGASFQEGYWAVAPNLLAGSALLGGFIGLNLSHRRVIYRAP